MNFSKGIQPDSKPPSYLKNAGINRRREPPKKKISKKAPLTDQTSKTTGKKILKHPRRKLFEIIDIKQIERKPKKHKVSKRIKKKPKQKKKKVQTEIDKLKQQIEKPSKKNKTYNKSRKNIILNTVKTIAGYYIKEKIKYIGQLIMPLRYDLKERKKRINDFWANKVKGLKHKLNIEKISFKNPVDPSDKPYGILAMPKGVKKTDNLKLVIHMTGQIGLPEDCEDIMEALTGEGYSVLVLSRPWENEKLVKEEFDELEYAICTGSLCRQALSKLKNAKKCILWGFSIGTSLLHPLYERVSQKDFKDKRLKQSINGMISESPPRNLIEVTPLRKFGMQKIGTAFIQQTIGRKNIPVQKWSKKIGFKRTGCN
ncbi:hypothetical protein ACFLZV_03880, partial [Candidatus Margulisiibacteriota bacterium]